ncbi:hypothetical protein bcgnr5372_27620 [Bacillus luti]|nr:hypothetical protein [Bacillus cereus]HDR8331233.1 hypothetical protein [Bacillus cereus]HDR8338282.1 hypothetical protein [Bacillus cereus]
MNELSAEIVEMNNIVTRYHMLLARNFEWINNVDNVEFSLAELEAAGISAEDTYKLVNHINSQNEQVAQDENDTSQNISFDGELLTLNVTPKRKEFIIRYMKVKLAEQVRDQQIKDIAINLYKNHGIKDADTIAKMTLSDVAVIKELLRNLG